ncbi:MAG: hypothetical protein J6A75_13890 [Lachnospiraceae bacterium]|nr:hypothetical protein [Lachnospiraceae bacterium]
MKKYMSLFLVLYCLLTACLGCGIEEYKAIGKQMANGNRENTERKTAKIEADSETESIVEPENTEESESVQETESMIEEADISYAQNYAYTTLDDTTKIVYHEVLDTILQHKEKVKVSTLDLEVLENAYDAVCADYGGLFWVSGYVYTQYTLAEKLIDMEFTPKYTMSCQEREQIQQQVDMAAEKFLEGISAVDTDYDKAKHVFDVLIKNVDYDISAEQNQNIMSVFLNRATVCQGYACATQYLLEKLGIQSTIVKGYVNGESHAWNLVRLNGKYYYMDTTWGNSRYKDASRETEKYVNYSYMLVSSEEISKTHVLDNSFPLPECSSMSHNYFVREGLYFSTWNPEAVGTVLKEAWDANEQGISLKFSSPELYEQVITYFVTEQHIADYCESISSIYYIEDAEQYVINFQFNI